MSQERKNIQSTKILATSSTDIDFFPTSDHPNIKTNVCMAAIIDIGNSCFVVDDHVDDLFGCVRTFR